MIRRAMRATHGEDGIAMVAVMGVLAVVTILSISAYIMAQQSLQEARLTQRQTFAFEAANAGMDVALAQIQANGFVLGTLQADGSRVLTGTVPGTGSYEVTLTALPSSEYLAVARGHGRDGGDELVQTKFFYLNLWEMNIAAGSAQSMTAGGGGITGTSNVTGPFYVRGSVELIGGAFVHKGPLFIKDGDLSFGSAASHVGTSLQPVRLFCTGSYETNANTYYAYVSRSVPDVTLPPTDLNYLTASYTKAIVESTDNLMGSGGGASEIPNYEAVGYDDATYTTMDPPGSALGSPIGPRTVAPGVTSGYKYIGADGGPTGAGNGTHGLTIGGTGSWGKYNYTGPGGATVHDDFAFDDSTNTLYVEGTIFIDGPLVIGGDGPVYYWGNGTIVANGPITIQDDCVPAAGFDASITLKQALGLVTPGTITCNAGDANVRTESDPPDVAGAWFAGDKIVFTANVLFRGSALAAGIEFGKPNIHMITNEALPTYLPDSLPGEGQSFLSRGSWSRP